MTDKPLICIDFDGVLNDYEGWRGPNYMYRPRPRVKEFLEKIGENYTIGIFSTRDPSRLREWFELYHLPYDKIVTKKLPALAYIDDRALRFDGNYDKVLYELERFHTHWEKETPQEIDEEGDRFKLAYDEKGGWWAVNDNGITLWKEEVVFIMNELYEERKFIASGFDEYQVQVAETLQKHYGAVKKSLNPVPGSQSDIYLGPIVQRACSRLLQEIAKELGVELK